MDLWRIDLDRVGQSLAPVFAYLASDGTAKSMHSQGSERNSVAIVVDGSRWADATCLVTSGDPRDARRILIIDAPIGPFSLAPAVQNSIAASVAKCESYNIDRTALDLAGILDPEFAFALIDAEKRSIALVRDPIGARPLYWRREKNVVAFASSRDRLIAAGPAPSINEAAVAITLASANDAWSKQELLAGFHRVPHGGYALISRESAATGQWWRPPLSSGERHKRDRVETASEVRALLERAVACRLGTSQSVGAHVSGGIDSTGVAAIGARYLATAHRSMIGAYAWSPALSESFPDMGWRDERRRIEAFTSKEGVPARFGGATAEDLVAFLSRPIELEGTADLADEMPVLQLAKTDGVQIMLSGWGGDEVFSSHGLSYLSHLLATLQWARAVRWIRAELRTLKQVGPLATLLWWSGVHPMLPDALHRMFDPYGVSDPKRSLISPALLRMHRAQVYDVSHAFRVTSRANETMFKHFMVGHITHRIETWDVWSRQYGFRYTYPLTDWRLIEKLLSLSPEEHFPAENPRGLAIDALADALPAGATKHDAANEASRAATRAGAWRILAQQERNGEFRYNCPWLDMKRLHERLANPVDQTIPAGILQFYEVFKAVRIWHMWTRQEGLMTNA